MYEIIEYVYRLVDPRDKQVRYIGRTANAFQRLMIHLSVNTHDEKYAWISELKSSGMFPIMEIIEAVIFDTEAPKERCISGREAYWIQFYKDQGAKLFNKLSYWQQKAASK